MMDLTQKGLPNVVWINGSPFSIYTDYRLWMRFEIEVGKLKRGQVMDISYLFKNEMPEHCNISELFSFSRPYSPLPRNIGAESDVIALDYELDGDLIYSAFTKLYERSKSFCQQRHSLKKVIMLLFLINYQFQTAIII